MGFGIRDEVGEGMSEGRGAGLGGDLNKGAVAVGVAEGTRF